MTAFATSRAGLLALAVAMATPAAAQTQYRFSLTIYDQPDYRGGSLTIYGDNANIGSTGFSARARSAQVRGIWRLCEGGGFRGRCETFNSNIPDLDPYGLSGRIGSAQLSGVNTVIGSSPPPAAPAPRYVAPTPAPRTALPYEAAGEPPAVDAPLAAPGRFARAPLAQAPMAQAPVTRAYVPPRAAPAPVPAPYAPAPAAYGGGPAQGRSAVFFPAPTIRGADVSARDDNADDEFCRAQGLRSAIYSDQTQRLPRAVDIDGRAVGEGPVLRDVLCRR